MNKVVLYIILIFVVSKMYANSSCIDSLIQSQSITHIKKTYKYSNSKKINYTLITSQKFQQRINPQLIFADYAKTDLYIGFNGAHVYLVHNGYRYDGGFGLYRKPVFVNAKKLLSIGAVIRIKDLSPIISNKLTNLLKCKKSSRSVNSSLEICLTLKNSGFNITKFDNILPSRLLDNLIANELLNSSGVPYSKEVYLFSNDADDIFSSLEIFNGLRGLKSMEIGIISLHVLLANYVYQYLLY